MDCRFDTTKAESIKTHGDDGFRYYQTSSDTEVVVNLLVSALSSRHRDEIAKHIPITPKSVLNLYLHAVFCMILTYRNHIRTVAYRGKH